MKNLTQLPLLTLCLGLASPLMMGETPKYEANWDSLSSHTQAPEWFNDAKFGIYFHWGPYSVPAFGSEWYPRSMFILDSREYKHHVDTYGDPSEFGYHDFIPQFKAEHFDPEEWADLFESAGARFAGPVAQHHDGFAMWDSKINPWNAKDKGPQKDILGSLFKSLKKRDLKTIATFHHARNIQRNADDESNWYTGYNSHYPYNPDFPTASTDPVLSILYGNQPIDVSEQYWLDQVNEVVDTYSPDIIWFDSWLNIISEGKRQEMVAHYLNEAENKNQEVVIGYKQGDIPFSIGVLDYEQGGRREVNQDAWMTDVTLSHRSWSYIEGQTYKTAELVVRNMIDVWSKNGVVLLNVSPRADGTIPDEQRTVLHEIGSWLESHGEAIYETRPHITHGFGVSHAKDGHHGGQSASTEYTADDIRYTVSKDGKSFFIFFLGKPESGKLYKIRQLGPHRYATPSPIKRVTLLGTNIEPDWDINDDNFQLTIPDAAMNDIANVFKLELE